MTHRILVIIKASFLPTAVELTRQHFNYTQQQAEEAWPVMGSTDGQPPPVYHWLSSEFSPTKKALLEQLAATHADDAQVFEYDFLIAPNFPQVKRAEMGIQPLSISAGWLAAPEVTP